MKRIGPAYQLHSHATGLRDKILASGMDCDSNHPAAPRLKRFRRGRHDRGRRPAS
jgi:hypothetical protein